jgi:hypothetical protein
VALVVTAPFLLPADAVSLELVVSDRYNRCPRSLHRHRRSMAKFQDTNFADRLNAAAKAKKAALEKFLAKPAEDDPALAERRAARAAALAARERRTAEKKAAREAAEAAAAIEQAAREEALKREEEARAIALKEEEAAREAEREAEAIRQVEREREQKAARDARYAARKARK